MGDLNGGVQSPSILKYRSYPKLGGHREYLLSLFSFLIAGASLIATNYSHISFFHEYGSNIAVGLFIAGFLSPIIQWLLYFMVAIIKRLTDYPQLHDITRSTCDDLVQLRETLFNLLHSLPYVAAIEIEKAAYVDSKVYIVLRRNGLGAGEQIEVGDVLTLLDFSDGLILGMIQVTEVRTREYYTVAQKGLDPILRGHIIHTGEVSVLPNIKAIYLPREVPDA